MQNNERTNDRMRDEERFLTRTDVNFASSP